MKAFICLIALLCASTSVLYSQTTPFRASQGISSAKKSAIDAGLPNPKLTSIATLGDTTFFGEYIPAAAKGILQFKFDPKAGTSSFWGYQYHDQKNGSDTSIAAIVIKILVAYQALQTRLPGIPGLPVRLDSALPSSFMDSDTMAAKITRNLLYKSHLSSYPNSKFQAVALGMSRGGLLPEGPLWIVTVGDKLTNPSLQCFVPATNNSGAAICEESPATSRVEEVLSEDRMSLYPNPAHNGRIRLHIPLSCYQPQLQLCVTNIMGESVYQKHIEHIGGGVDAELDLHEISAGYYFVRIGTAPHQVVLPFILEH